MSVEGHYTSGRMGSTILEALAAAGQDVDHLDPEVLGLVDEFHTLGRAGTVALAEAAGIGPDDHVLDVGCGLGGPSRFLAGQRGCRVTGIDLTAEFCEVAQDLNRRTGLADRVEVRQADALDLPFPDGSFDVAWSQHVAMNIADKAALYRELRRVVRPGGRLAIFDVVAGPGGSLYFPVPWAATPDISFLETADAVGQKVEAAGFKPTLWEDVTEEAIAFFARLAQRGTAPALGVHLLMADWVTKVTNARRNLEEGRAKLLRGVATAS